MHFLIFTLVLLQMKSEGAAMWDAAVSLRDAMVDLGVACDGGKDSLSMAASADGEIVMAPGNLVVSAYVGCPDITQASSRMHNILCLLVS